MTFDDAWTVPDPGLLISAQSEYRFMTGGQLKYGKNFTIIQEKSYHIYLSTPSITPLNIR